MFDDLLGKKEEKPTFDEDGAEKYADHVNEKYKKLKQSTARFKFDLKKFGINDIEVDEDEEDDDLAESIKKAIEQIMRQHGRPDAEIEREKKRVDKEMKKKICSDTDGGCDTCGGNCNEGECEDVWGNLTGCLKREMSRLAKYSISKEIT